MYYYYYRYRYLGRCFFHGVFVLVFCGFSFSCLYFLALPFHFPCVLTGQNLGGGIWWCMGGSSFFYTYVLHFCNPQRKGLFIVFSPSFRFFFFLSFPVRCHFYEIHVEWRSPFLFFSCPVLCQPQPQCHSQFDASQWITLCTISPVQNSDFPHRPPPKPRPMCSMYVCTYLADRQEGAGPIFSAVDNCPHSGRGARKSGPNKKHALSHGDSSQPVGPFPRAGRHERPRPSGV